ncbi:MAG TPA: zf-HC2 domain-containing protein [Actinomycetota bacterium]|nr:zf-HC2 domain-containing protein [Actinomycetota bacterium]
MNCATARDRLSEHALGVVGGREADALDRHLEWCAACRKEARDLGRAAAVLPYALAPAEPSAELEDRIVDAVRVAAGGGRPVAAPRRSRLATVAVLAAAMAVSGLGWGAVMAGRASRAEESAEAAAVRSQRAIFRFSEVFDGLEFADSDVQLGLLVPTEIGGGASGTAATVVVPGANDTVLVVMSGLVAEGDAPYTVALRGGPEDSLVVGVVPSALIATDGTAEFAATPVDDLRRFDRVVVTNTHGDVVLRGALEARVPVPSPSP